MSNMLILILCAILAQGITWLQTNGQLVWPWMKDYKYIILLISYPIGLLFWICTEYGYPAFNGQLWPVRFLIHVAGILVFIVFTTWLLKEPLTIKIGVQIALCFAIMAVQFFWKT